VILFYAENMISHYLGNVKEKKKQVKKLIVLQ